MNLNFIFNIDVEKLSSIQLTVAVNFYHKKDFNLKIFFHLYNKQLTYKVIFNRLILIKERKLDNFFIFIQKKKYYFCPVHML